MNRSDDEVEAIAARAAKTAIRDFLLTLGIATDDPEAILQMQKDFAYVRAWRESIETVRRQSLKTAVATIVAGALGALWLIFKGPPF